MSEPKKQNYLHGAVILAFSTVIVKILGAIYKIPLYNMLGDAATTHFAVAYNIYSVLLTVSTAGLPVALSRMIAEANTLGHQNEVRRIFKVGYATFFTLGLVCSLLMLVMPRQLATLIAGKDDATYSIIALAPSVFFVCVMSAYRGYTQGYSNMTPTGISQVIEVFCKLVFGLVLAWLALHFSLGKPMASAGAIAGVSIGSVVAAVYMFFAKRNQEHAGSNSDDVPSSPKTVLLRLLKIGIPIAIGSCLFNLLNLVDNKVVLGRLQSAAGFTYDEATVLYGVYFKVQTLFNLPTAFIVPITVSVIPAISSYRTAREYRQQTMVTESSMRIATLMSLPMAIGMAVLAFPITNVIYPGSAAEGPALLRVLGIASYFVCMYLMITAILQACGYERLPLYMIPVGAVVKIALNWLLIGNPDIGIMGATVATLACYLVMSAVLLGFVVAKLPEKPKLGRVFVKPFICSAAMGAAVWASYTLIYRLLSNSSLMLASARRAWLLLAASMIIAIVIGVVVYIVLVIGLRALTPEDVKLLPKGEKIAKILKIK